jgi:DNA-directed RNA polymerase specialized sigma24 family protein
MSDANEAVEGQSLANEILRALDEGRRVNWDPLERAYGQALRRAAGALLASSAPSTAWTADDVWHDFLVCRVLPRALARKMFAPSARGEAPLRPRLLTSLGNHFIDLVRSDRARRVQYGGDDILAAVPERVAQPLPTYEEVRDLVGRQQAAIRNACPLRRRPNGAAYRESLLVQLRLDWAGGFDGVRLCSQTAAEPVELSLALLERLTAWHDQEDATPLVEGGPPLGVVWERAKETLSRAPERRVSVGDLAALVPVSRDVWNQWTSRGRRMLRALLGKDYTRIFAVWDGRGEGT